MAKTRLESQWWQTSWIVATVRNSVQTDPSAAVTPAEVNPMISDADRPKRSAGVVVTDEEFEAVFKRNVTRKGA